MNIRREYVITGLLLLILLMATALRFCYLDAQSLWNDEGSSVALAQRDLATIARDAALDIHPPLYYWLLSFWVRLAGNSEAAVRALSACLGVVLVALTYMLGRVLAGRLIGLAAAFLAAIHPFQVYYAQEARMYMLLAVLTAGAVLALVRLTQRESIPILVILVLLEAAGLYTHYSFFFVVLVLNLAYALWLALSWRQPSRGSRVLVWGLAQVAVLLLYLPWLPTTIRQVTAWPSPVQTLGFLPALAHAWCWLVFGPTIETGSVAIPLWLSGLVALLGAMALAAGWLEESRRRSWWSAALLVLWIGLPLLLMLGLGLYRPAYLKFLLVATPAVGVLLACGLLVPWPTKAVRKTDDRPRRAEERRQTTEDPWGSARLVLRIVQAVVAVLILIPMVLSLRNYYVDPAYARDDYRAIVAYVEAVGREGDAVLLNAPGQQEVFAYYYRGDLPIHPLPEDRPLDPVATEAALQELAEGGGRVFALLWATDESDPQRFIEGWLDSHAYKALDSWYGNVRLVVYAMPEQIPTIPDLALDIALHSGETGDEVVLHGYSLLNDRLAAGDIVQITLFWQVDQSPTRRYKVFLHVLDEANHIVGQRDAEPGGGARPTTLWKPGEVVTDNYGLPIHPATAPGEYRVEVGMYDPQTGQRLLAPDGADQVWLEPLVVERPPAPASVAALGIEHIVDADFGELVLLGYDLHRLGFAHQPDAPLLPGDVVHVNLYWRAESQPTGDWQVEIQVVGTGGREWASLQAEPVGGYATEHWLTGDVWRGQFNLALPGDTPPGRYRLRIRPLAPDGTSPGEFLSESFEVGP